MQYLGPLSSLTTGTRKFYISMTNQLNTNEYLSELESISSNDVLLGLASGAILSSNLTTSDGSVLASGKAISFIASCSGSHTNLATLIIDYATNQGNDDSCIAYLKIVPSI